MLKHIFLTSVAGILPIILCGAAEAHRHSEGTGPDPLSLTSSIGDALHAPGSSPIHIIYVHGIGAEGNGDSFELQRNICQQLHARTNCKSIPNPVREFVSEGVFSPAKEPSYEFMGAKIWNSSEEWAASAPFIDHYVISLSGNRPIILDEINWWPLVFPLKCRNIMKPEANLAGLMNQYLNDCARKTERGPDHTHFKQYAWITEEQAKQLKREPYRASVVNGYLKNSVIDWGFADAMLASGSLHDLFVDAMRQLFAKAAAFNPDGSKSENWHDEKRQEFILVTHSLGSYLALSTLDLDHPAQGASTEMEAQRLAVGYVFKNTAMLYFFANQVPLLELGSIKPREVRAEEDGHNAPAAPGRSSLHQNLELWSGLRGQLHINSTSNCPDKSQIIAFSDPNDLLTYRVPKIANTTVVNVYVKNSIRWLWLLEWPTSAHGNYVNKKAVIKVLLRKTHNSCTPVPNH